MSDRTLSCSIDWIRPQRSKAHLPPGLYGSQMDGCCRRAPTCYELQHSSGSPAKQTWLAAVTSPAELNSCISTSASVLCSICAKWSFLSSHQPLFFFFPYSQGTVRNVEGFCFFMLPPHVLLCSKVKWNLSALPWFPKVLSTEVREETQLSKIAGRGGLQLCARSDPNLAKLPLRDRPRGLHLF